MEKNLASLNNCAEFKRRGITLDLDAARLFREEQHEDGHVFYRQGEKKEHPLFFVLRGSVRLTRAGCEQICGPGSIFGEDTVFASLSRSLERQAREHKIETSQPFRRQASEYLATYLMRTIAERFDEGALTTALSLGQTTLLALEPKNIDKVFGSLETPSRQALIGMHHLRKFAPGAVEMFQRSPEFAHLDRLALSHLLAGATVINTLATRCSAAHPVLHQTLKTIGFHVCPPQQEMQLLEAGERPDSVYVLVEGKLTYTWPGGFSAEKSAPALVGSDNLIQDKPMDFNVTTRGMATLLRLSSDATRGMRKRRNKHKSVVDPGQDDVQSSKGRKVLLLCADETLLEHRPEIQKTLRSLTDLLAERLAAHLCNWVLVIHLEPPGLGTEGSPKVSWYDSDIPGYSGGDDTIPTQKLWVEHRYVPLPDGKNFLHAIQEQLSKSCQNTTKADIVLIDASAVTPFDDDGNPAVKLPVGVENAELLKDERLQYIWLHDHLYDQRSEPGVKKLVEEGTVISTAMFESQDFLDQFLLWYGELKKQVHKKTQKPTMQYSRRLINTALNKFTDSTLAAAFNTLRSQIDSSKPREWPSGTVRVRIPWALFESLSKQEPVQAPTSFESLKIDKAELAAARRAFDRWARGITGLQIGLALGGGGTYGGVFPPLIRALEKSNIPIDLISGSSVGATVGAYYAVLGLEGLNKLQFEQLLGLLPLILWRSVFFEWKLLGDLGGVRLDQTEVAFFPVATDADIGVASHFRQGTYARGVRASGSLPPVIQSTRIGNRRFVDGGLTANVPINVLREEGAGFVIAANPISRVEGLNSRDPRFLSSLGGLKLRANDFFRMMGMLFQAIGETEMAGADVIYRPDAGEASLFAFRDPKYREMVEKTQNVNQVLADFQLRFSKKLRHPPALVYFNAEGRRIEVRAPILFEVNEETLTHGSARILNKVAEFLLHRQDVKYLCVRVYASKSKLAKKRALELIKHLKAHGVKQRMEPVGEARLKEALSLEVMDISVDAQMLKARQEPIQGAREET